MKDKRFKLIKTEPSNYYLESDLKLTYAVGYIRNECSYRGISLALSRENINTTLTYFMNDLVIDMNEIDCLLDSEIMAFLDRRIYDERKKIRIIKS